ncbi:MAG: MBL fold metallo-hydrolase [Candidatus Bathyarchaeia archaeon]
MRFTPLAAESLGVRSMCTYVETPDVRILIDPGVSLGPRFSLLPHPKEYRALISARNRLSSIAKQAEIVTISHYHFDHATPAYTDYVWNFSNLAVAEQLYKDKLVFAKDYRSAINPSQRRRGWMLHQTMEKSVCRFEVADGQVYIIGGTKLKFSEPVYHGERGSVLGWVLMLTVEHDDERFLHASDVQGPIVPETAEKIIAEKPKMLYIGGPPTYLAEYRQLTSKVESAWDSLERIVRVVPQVIIDHHFMRAGEWPLNFMRVIDASKEAGHRICTAAQALGMMNELLESQRMKLYLEEPPSKEFLDWTRLPDERRRLTMPPV